MKTLRTLCAAAFCAVVTACSGGDSGSAQAPAPPVAVAPSRSAQPTVSEAPGTAAIAGVSLKLPPGWVVRDREDVYYRAFGPPDGSEDEGGNLIRPAFLVDASGKRVPMPPDPLSVLRTRTDLTTQVVHEESLQGRRAQHVQITPVDGEDRALWCVKDTTDRACFFTGRADLLVVLIADPAGPVVMDVFGAPAEAAARAREFTAALRFT